MTYLEFIQKVRDGIAACCDERDEVILKTITKNNGLKLDAVVIQREGRDISPSIYLKRYFEEYEDGMSIEQIIDTIMFIEKNCKLECDLRTKDLTAFDYVKDHVCMKLVNTNRNAEMLADMPSRTVLDLSIIYYVLVDTKDDCVASYLIRHENCKNWGVTEEQLYKIAKENTFNLFPVTVTSMYDMVLSMMPSDASEELQEALETMNSAENGTMFVVTNDRKHFGATAFLYEEFLNTFAQAHGDFIILPSSVHELIFLTDVHEPDRDWLYHMVRNVNETELSTDEVLSESVYRYNAITRKMELL